MSLDVFCRGFPLILSIIILTLGYITQAKVILFYGAVNFVENILNYWILKSIFWRYVYHKDGNQTLPILGLGNRPEGAHSCGLFLDNCREHTFGMPSGHAGLVTSFSTFFTLYLLTYSTSQYKLWMIAGLIILTLIISYSRIRFNCHTVNQVLVGNLFGLIMGTINFIVYSYLLRFGF